MSEHFCTRGGTEHAFEPRFTSYRRLPPRLTRMDSVQHADKIMETGTTYMGDVCVRCGIMVNQTAPKGAAT